MTGQKSLPNEGYSRIQLSADALETSVLNVLDGIDRMAAPGACIEIQLSSDQPMSDGDATLRRAGLEAMAGFLGWSAEEQDKPAFEGEWLIFKKTPGVARPRYRLRTPGPENWPDALSLFERAFGEPASPALWAWKYEGARNVSVVALRGDSMVAHYGCVSRAVNYRGAPAHTVQICDVMVDPAERGLMTRTGAFFQAARASQESIIGFGGEHLFGFGFPNQRHMVLGSRAGLYSKVEHLVEYRWATHRARPSALTTARAIPSITEVAAKVDDLWRQMARGLSDLIVGVRDASYLKYRYEIHPKFSYHVFLIEQRLSRRPLGLLVLRGDGEVCRLIDLVGPVESIELMVDYAQRIASRMGFLTLVAWISSGQSRYFEASGGVKHPLDIQIPGNCLVQRVPVSDLEDRWWLMMGDTDFL